MIPVSPHRILFLLALAMLLAAGAHAQSRGLIVEPPTGQGSMDPIDLIRAENPVQEFDVIIGTVDGRTSVTEGETVQFLVRSERSGYVTLLNQTPDGKVIFLYPNKWSPYQRIEANESVYFPASAQDFRIRVAEPFGREYIKAIVTPKPLIDAEQAERFWDHSPLLAVEGPPEGGGSSDLGGFDPGQWAATSMSLNTAPREPEGGTPVAVPDAPEANYSDTPAAMWDEVFQSVNGDVSTRSMSTEMQQEQSDPLPNPLPNDVLVLYKPKVGTRAFGNSMGGGNLFNNIRVVEADRDSYNAAGTRSLSDYGDSVAERLEGLNRDDDVLVAVPNYPVYLYDAVEKVSLEAPALDQAMADATASRAPAYWDLQWGLHNGFYRSSSNRVDMRWRNALQRYRNTSEPIIVAVLDSGIHLDNPNLEPILWQNDKEIPNNGVDDDGNGYVDDYHGWDAYAQDADPSDTNRTDSHGTFVASQIAVKSSSADFFGLAPNVRIMPVRVLGPNGGSTESVVEGIKYAARNGAKIINMSLGMTIPTSEPRMEAFYREIFKEVETMGGFIVMAAGNENADSRSTYSYPARANADNTLTVAALEIGGNRASFSNYGPRVDLSAPGARIIGHPAYDRRVAGWNGTSMAAPYVSAAAALIWSQHPGWTPAQVKDRIVDTVKPVSGLDVRTGGLIDIEAALGK